MPKVIVTDSGGEILEELEGNAEESLAVQAQDHGAPIPMSCGVGACRTCLCTVEEGIEWIDPEAVSSQQIPTEENEILSCIASLKKDTPADAEIKIQAQNL